MVTSERVLIKVHSLYLLALPRLGLALSMQNHPNGIPADLVRTVVIEPALRFQGCEDLGNRLPFLVQPSDRCRQRFTFGKLVSTLWALHDPILWPEKHVVNSAPPQGHRYSHLRMLRLSVIKHQRERVNRLQAFAGTAAGSFFSRRVPAPTNPFSICTRALSLKRRKYAVHRA